ncbi:MAG: radical SAM protein [Candidatus Omnitrophica bacterium]|nr:radical SAM protein [Candidatus Omnitrophota bacterium]
MPDNLGTYVLNFDSCNQRCLFCLQADYINRGNRVTYSKVAKEIIDAKKMGYKNIDFYGGEPTCFAFLKRTVRLANSLSLTATLATNCVRFSSLAYAESFFSGVKIAGLRTSLHSHKPQVHDAITQVQGSFLRTIAGIGNVLRHNKRLSVNIVIHKLNYEEIINMVYYIYGLGVRGIKFSGLSLQGNLLKNRWLLVDPDCYSARLIKAIESSRKLGFRHIEVEKLPPRILGARQLKFVRFPGT